MYLIAYAKGNKLVSHFLRENQHFCHHHRVELDKHQYSLDLRLYKENTSCLGQGNLTLGNLPTFLSKSRKLSLSSHLNFAYFRVRAIIGSAMFEK